MFVRTVLAFDRQMRTTLAGGDSDEKDNKYTTAVLDSLHKLNRPEQVLLFRMRTGHNRHSAHMHSKFKAGESEMCPCNADIMTSEHLLQRCQSHDALRRDV